MSDLLGGCIDMTVDRKPTELQCTPHLQPIVSPSPPPHMQPIHPPPSYAAYTPVCICREYWLALPAAPCVYVCTMVQPTKVY